MSDGNRVELRLPRESLASAHLDLMWSPHGPDFGAAKAETLNVLAEGSGFLYYLDGRNYLVTARHNFSGRHWQTNACLGHPAVEPTHIRLAFLSQPPPEGWPIEIERASDRHHSGSLKIFMPIYLLPLIGEDWKPIWLQHPDYGERMDAAVLAIKDGLSDVFTTPWEPPQQGPGGVIWPGIAAGDDVFIVGYPYGLSSGPLLPLWMRGTVATEPMLGFRIDGEDLPLMLIDARTREGQSGSPVLRRRPAGTALIEGNQLRGFTSGPQSEIVGVYSGRTRDDSDLGFVWRIDQVDRICRDGVPGSIFI